MLSHKFQLFWFNGFQEKCFKGYSPYTFFSEDVSTQFTAFWPNDFFILVIKTTCPPCPWVSKKNIMFSYKILFFNFYSRNCPKGFYGDNCDKRCPYPNYGQYCSLICDCTEQKCHYANGCPRLGTCINY